MNAADFFQREDIKTQFDIISTKLADAMIETRDALVQIARIAGMDNPDPWAQYSLLSILSTLLDAAAEDSTHSLDIALSKFVKEMPDA